MASRSKTLKTTLTIIAASILAVGPAVAGDVSIGINAYARTICKVEVAAAAVPNYETGETNLGRMTELCNNVDGYRLVLNHPAGLVDAWVVVDGQRLQISPTSTRTVIVDSDRPALRERDLGIVLSSAQPALDLSLVAEAKGMIF